MRSASVRSKTVEGSPRSAPSGSSIRSDPIDDGVDVDEAAGGRPPLDAVFLEVDAQRAQQVAPVAPIVLEEGPSGRGRSSRDRLGSWPEAASPYGPRALVATITVRRGQASASGRGLAPPGGRPGVVVRALAAVRETTVTGPAPATSRKAAWSSLSELTEIEPARRGGRPTRTTIEPACSTARLRGARVASRSRTTSRQRRCLVVPAIGARAPRRDPVARCDIGDPDDQQVVRLGRGRTPGGRPVAAIASSLAIGAGKRSAAASPRRRSSTSRAARTLAKASATPVVAASTSARSMGPRSSSDGTGAGGPRLATERGRRR